MTKDEPLFRQAKANADLLSAVSSGDQIPVGIITPPPRHEEASVRVNPVRQLTYCYCYNIKGAFISLFHKHMNSINGNKLISAQYLQDITVNRVVINTN